MDNIVSFPTMQRTADPVDVMLLRRQLKLSHTANSIELIVAAALAYPKALKPVLRGRDLSTKPARHAAILAIIETVLTPKSG